MVVTEAVQPGWTKAVPLGAPGTRTMVALKRAPCRWWAGADASLGVEGSRAALTRRTGRSVADARSPEGSRYSGEQVQRSKCCLFSNAIGMTFSCCQALQRLVAARSRLRYYFMNAGAYVS
ncbi:hypothetical protein A6A27_32210 [Micromonospora sp. CB01531]|nr:hypothetical protein A6A27_32210 [Micromonospora sp. CB01531]